MSQFLRPSSNVTQTNFTGGYAEMDETSASDGDFAYSDTPGATCTLEVALSAGMSPGVGVTTVRYRYVKSKVSNGDPSANETDPTLQAFVYEGATLRATDSLLTLSSGSYVTREWTPDLSAVSDWSALRLRFVCETNSGPGDKPRGASISWAEVETPSPGGGFMVFF